MSIRDVFSGKQSISLGDGNDWVDDDGIWRSDTLFVYTLFRYPFDCTACLRPLFPDSQLRTHTSTVGKNIEGQQTLPTTTSFIPRSQPRLIRSVFIIQNHFT